MLKKIWEKIDQYITLILGFVIALALVATAIKFANWAAPLLQIFAK